MNTTMSLYGDEINVFYSDLVKTGPGFFYLNGLYRSLACSGFTREAYECSIFILSGQVVTIVMS